MRDTIRFVASEVSLDPHVGFIGFADRDGQHYFWMQPSETTTSKDEIWLERDDQAWGGYGGAWNVVLTRKMFRIDTQTLSWMACDAIKIELDVGDETYERLKQLLRRVMIDCASDLAVED